MRSQDEHQDFSDSNSFRELELLSELDQDPDVSQRQLSNRIGIALGLTNVLLRNMAKKGYIKVGQATWKRRLYTLTPEGFFHRVRLMRVYVSRVMADYQKVRCTLKDELQPYSLNAESRVAIVGTGEFAELVFLGLKDIGIEEIDVFSTRVVDDQKFLGMPVREISTIHPELYDQMIVGMLTGLESTCEQILDRGADPKNLVTFFSDGRAREAV